jgi:ABC-type maltose transport system permease subunit
VGPPRGAWQSEPITPGEPSWCLGGCGGGTFSLGVATFYSQHGLYAGTRMAATTVVTLPIILLLLLAQRTFIRGIALTGLKG